MSFAAMNDSLLLPWKRNYIRWFRLNAPKNFLIRKKFFSRNTRIWWLMRQGWFTHRSFNAGSRNFQNLSLFAFYDASRVVSTHTMCRRDLTCDFQTLGMISKLNERLTFTATMKFKASLATSLFSLHSSVSFATCGTHEDLIELWWCLKSFK